MNRKQALKTIAASAAGAIAIPGYGTFNASLKGNINHSVCQWCYSSGDLEGQST